MFDLDLHRRHGNAGDFCLFWGRNGGVFGCFGSLEGRQTDYYTVLYLLVIQLLRGGAGCDNLSDGVDTLSFLVIVCLRACAGVYYYVTLRNKS